MTNKSLTEISKLPRLKVLNIGKLKIIKPTTICIQSNLCTRWLDWRLSSVGTTTFLTMFYMRVNLPKHSRDYLWAKTWAFIRHRKTSYRVLTWELSPTISQLWAISNWKGSKTSNLKSLGRWVYWTVWHCSSVLSKRYRRLKDIAKIRGLTLTYVNDWIKLKLTTIFDGQHYNS